MLKDSLMCYICHFKKVYSQGLVRLTLIYNKVQTYFIQYQGHALWVERNLTLQQDQCSRATTWILDQIVVRGRMSTT